MKKKALICFASLVLLVAVAPPAVAEEDCFPGTIVSHPWYGYTCVDFEYLDCYSCRLVIVAG